jgi:hypothetical protein
MAHYGWTWLGVGGHWLPTWLPEVPLAWLMFERSNTLSTRTDLDLLPGTRGPQGLIISVFKRQSPTRPAHCRRRRPRCRRLSEPLIVLPALQARTVAGCGQDPPCASRTCGNSGWTWPGVAWRPASLAPRKSLAALLPGSEWVEQCQLLEMARMRSAGFTLQDAVADCATPSGPRRTPSPSG